MRFEVLRILVAMHASHCRADGSGIVRAPCESSPRGARCQMVCRPGRPLKRRKALGLTGAGLATLATVMGGSQVAVAGPVARSHHVGLDWFLLDLFLLSAIFVPLELLFGRLREQPIFRPGWRTDLWHFGVSHLLVQVTVLLTMAPAALFFRWATAPELQAFVASQPYALQFLGVLVVPISPSTPCTASSTSCRGSGASTRSITPAATSTGWPAPGCTWSTSSSPAA